MSNLHCYKIKQTSCFCVNDEVGQVREREREKERREKRERRRERQLEAEGGRKRERGKPPINSHPGCYIFSLSNVSQ